MLLLSALLLTIDLYRGFTHIRLVSLDSFFFLTLIDEVKRYKRNKNATGREKITPYAYIIHLFADWNKRDLQ